MDSQLNIDDAIDATASTVDASAGVVFAARRCTHMRLRCLLPPLGAQRVDGRRPRLGRSGPGLCLRLLRTTRDTPHAKRHGPGGPQRCTGRVAELACGRHDWPCC